MSRSGTEKWYRTSLLHNVVFVGLEHGQILIVEGGGVDQLQANDIHDSWDLALSQVQRIY